MFEGYHYYYTYDYQLCVEYDVDEGIFQKIEKIPLEQDRGTSHDEYSGDYQYTYTYSGSNKVIFKGTLKPDVQLESISTCYQVNSWLDRKNEWQGWGAQEGWQCYDPERVIFYDDESHNICLSMELEGYYEHITDSEVERQWKSLWRRYLIIRGRVGAPQKYECDLLRGLVLAKQEKNTNELGSGYENRLFALARPTDHQGHYLRLFFGKMKSMDDCAAMKLAADDYSYHSFRLYRNDHFEDQDEGIRLEDIVLDGGPNFFNLVSTRKFAMCDTSGKILNVQNYSEGNITAPHHQFGTTQSTYNGKKYIMDIGPREGFVQLSSTDRYKNMFYHKNTTTISSNYDFSYKIQDFIHGYNEYGGIETSASQDKSWPYAYYDYMLDGMSAFIAVSADDETTLRKNLLEGISAELTRQPAAQQGANEGEKETFPLAGFIALNQNGRMLSVSDANVEFVQAVPFDERKWPEDKVHFMTAHKTLIPVFVDSGNCLITLVGQDSPKSLGLLPESEQLFYDKIKPVITGENDQSNITPCKQLSAWMASQFCEQIKDSAKYRTTFINVRCHGQNTGKGEAFTCIDGTVDRISNRKMYEILNSGSKNVVFWSMCCYSAGTIMPGRPTAYPNNLLGGRKKPWPVSKDGKSIFYLVNDASTSPAHSIAKGVFMDYIAVGLMDKYKDMTYAQFAEKFNGFITRCKQCAYGELFNLVQRLLKDDVLNAKTPEFDVPMLNPWWRLEFMEEADQVKRDLKELGLKYPLDEIYAGSSCKNSLLHKSAFWRQLYHIFSECEERECNEYCCQEESLTARSLRISLSQLRNAFWDCITKGIGKGQLFGEGNGRELHADIYKLLYTICYCIGYDKYSPPEGQEITLEYLCEEYNKITNKFGRKKLGKGTSAFMLENKKYLFGWYTDKVYGDSMAFWNYKSRVNDMAKRYDKFVDKVSKIFLSTFYDIVLGCYNIMKEELGLTNQQFEQDFHSRNYPGMILVNFLFDYPHAGFLRTTEEFANRKFLT